MLDILNIEGLVPDAAHSFEEKDRVVIAVQRRPNPEMRCPACGGYIVGANGTRQVEYTDLPVRGKKTVLQWDRQRFLCLDPDCRKSFSDVHEDLHPTRQMTMRAYNWIGKRSIDHTFVDVAQDIGLSERAVAAVFHEWAEEQFRGLRIVTPRVLGVGRAAPDGQGAPGSHQPRHEHRDRHAGEDHLGRPRSPEP